MSLANALTNIVATGMLKLLNTIVVSEYRRLPTMPYDRRQRQQGNNHPSSVRNLIPALEEYDSLLLRTRAAVVNFTQRMRRTQSLMRRSPPSRRRARFPGGSL